MVSEYADAIGAGTLNSAWQLMENYHRAALIINVGDMVATATLDISIRQASDSAGTGTKAITDKSITQLTQAGGDGNQILVIELRTEELDIANGFEYIGVRSVVANANVELGWTLLGIVPRYKPVATTNWSEIVD